MLLRPPRSRRIDSTVRNVLVTVSVALIGTAVGGVGMLSVVTAVTQPPSSDLRAPDAGVVGATNAGAVVAARWPVVITSPHEPQGAGRTPTADTAAAAPGPANTIPQSPKTQSTSPERLLGGVEAPKAGSQASGQSPAARTSGSSNDSSNGGDNRRETRRTSPSHTRHLAGGASPRDGTTGQPASNNAANFAAAQRRDMAARPPMFDYSGGGNYRDYRYPGPARSPGGVTAPRDRAFDGGDRSGGWGGWGSSFGGNGWGDYRD